MSSPQLSALVWLVILVGVFYFFLVRPQQKRVKEHQKLMESLKIGDQVVTIGGIHGVINSLGEETVSLEVSKAVILTVSRNAISRKK
ncbi:MAG TPA: preprotein translocase subunit YajC [Candidatus Subteraquimicrobiales bacterium]